MFEIRKAAESDIDAICRIYLNAREFMASHGNPGQWGDGYPWRKTVEDDISAGNLYLVYEGDSIAGVFAMIRGGEPTYKVIEDGAWLNDDDYITIHRVASAFGRKGVLTACVGYCLEQCKNIRIDTHSDNTVMRNALKKAGFVRCGIIYVRNHSPRIAYQLCISE